MFPMPAENQRYQQAVTHLVGMTLCQGENSIKPRSLTLQPFTQRRCRRLARAVVNGITVLLFFKLYFQVHGCL
jgi:hypothetical protein